MVDLPAHLRVNASQLKERLQKEDIYLIDVRNPPEIEEHGYILSKRRINIPFPQFEAALSLNNDEYKAKYGLDKPSGDGADLVIHCMIGGRGSKAAVIADNLGYKKVQNLDGGFKKWKEDGFA